MLKIEQGDIYKDIEIIEEVTSEPNNEVTMTRLFFPYVIVLSQDCDLFQSVSEIEKNMKKDENYVKYDEELIQLQGKEKLTGKERSRVLELTKLKSDIVKNNDKQLFSVLLLPIYNFDLFKSGNHLVDLGLTMFNFDADPNNLIMHINTNNHKRYHKYKIMKENLEVISDFKHYFTVKLNKLLDLKEKGHFVENIGEIERLDISHRFAGFLSRIGLNQGN